MKLRFLAIFLFAVSLHASPMYRVVAIAGPSSIVVERDGVRSTVQLSGIEVTDARNATAFLQWSVNSTWVMIDDGKVYRSPDGMLVNDELVRKGFARSLVALPPRTNAVYLGELDLEKRPTPKAPAPRARSARRSPVRRPAPPSRTARAPLR